MAGVTGLLHMQQCFQTFFFSCGHPLKFSVEIEVLTKLNPRRRFTFLTYLLLSLYEQVTDSQQF